MFNLIRKKLPQTERARFTVLQAAKHLGVSREYVYQQVRSGKIPSHIYLDRICIFVDDCILKRQPKSLTRKRRTKEEIKREKATKERRKYRKLAEKKKLASLPEEERLKIRRKKKARMMRRYREKKRTEATIKRVEARCKRYMSDEAQE